MTASSELDRLKFLFGVLAMLKKKWGWFFAAFCLFFLVSRCGQQGPQWNVVIVTFDTTRADRLECYGNQRIKTPHLNALAADGVLFERAYAPIPITLPSHSSIMTGKVPFVHGVRDNGVFVLGEEQITLAEILSDQGYATGAAVGSFPLISRFGIDQGFSVFDDQLNSGSSDPLGLEKIKKKALFFDERRAGRVNDALIPWLEQQGKKPFFAWFHYFDPHHPHEPPPPYNQLYVDDLYNGEIAYSDEQLGQIVTMLKEQGVYENTLFVFTSDHGEGLGEHNESTHSLLCYNGTLHVPLIIKIPGTAKGRRVGQRVGTVDIFPTVLDALKLRTPVGIQGRSLLPLFDPNSQAPVMEDVPQYAETLSPRISHGWGELRVMFDADYKYIHGPRSELFDLMKDPQELDDLIEKQPEVATRLKVLLQQYLDEHAVANLDASIVIDQETADRLMALGYIQTAGNKVGMIEERLREDGTPPQDRAGDNSAYSMAKNQLFKGKPMLAMGYVNDLLSTAPDNPHYLALRLKAELAMGQTSEAISTIETLLELDQGYPPPKDLLKSLGSIYIQKRNFPVALEMLTKAQNIAKDAAGQYLLSQLQGMSGNPEASFLALQESLALDHQYLPAQLAMATYQATNGDPEGAKSMFEQAMRDHPYNAQAFYNYGVFLVQDNQYEMAIGAFERTIKLQPNYARAYLALVDIFSALEYQELAATYYEILRQIAPQSQELQLAKQFMETE